MITDDENNKANKVDEKPFKVTRLVDIDLADGVENALKECLDSKVSVFIKCPKQRTLWAIPDDYEQCVEEHKNSKRNLSPYEASRCKKTIFFPRSPSLVNTDNILLQLKRTDVNDLLIFKRTGVIDFEKIYSLEKSSGFISVKSVQTMPYPLKKFEPIDYPFLQQLNKTAPNSTQKLEPASSKYLSFILCTDGKRTLETLNDPLDHRLSLEIKFEDCFIQTKSKSKLSQKAATKLPQIDYLVSDVPKGSPYFVEEGCRYSLLLNKLAVLGYQIFEKQSIPLPRNLTKYIQSEFKITKKLAETAALFIVPSQKDTIKSKFKGEVQFKYLLDAYKEFYLDGKLKKNKDKNSLNQKISNYIGKHFGYSDEKCRYAVKLIRPDNKKGGL